jgi:type II secretory pathway pseudopilin PulG
MKLQADAGQILGVTAAIVALAAVSAVIWLNPPADNRARAMDRQRMIRLSATQSAIKDYFTKHKALPANLGALDAESKERQRFNWRDPGTDKPFEYEIKGEKSYHLCAIFERNSGEGAPYFYARVHDAGRDCMDYQVSPN